MESRKPPAVETARCAGVKVWGAERLANRNDVRRLAVAAPAYGCVLVSCLVINFILMVAMRDKAKPPAIGSHFWSSLEFTCSKRRAARLPSRP